MSTLLDSAKHAPLFVAGAATVTLDVQVEHLVKQRPPLLLVDRVEHFDPVQKMLRAWRTVRADDPVFAGHFPGNPVYPGVLSIEAMGQSCLCLLRLLDLPEPSDTPPETRFTRIKDAVFLRPVRPGDTLELVSALVDEDTLRATAVTQLLVAGAISAACELEVCFV